jgi:dienelactone hydrolase
MRAFPLFALVAMVSCAPGPVEEALGVDVQRRTLTPDGGGGSVDADVFTPKDAAGPLPAVVVVQGGLVPIERYRWLGAQLAQRGAIVAMPTHPFDLPIFAIDHATRALFGLRGASNDETDRLAGLVGTPAIVCGHSLGGVVAAKAWRSSVAFQSLALFASYPEESDDFAGRGGRVLSMVGGADQKATLDDVVKGAAAFDAAQVVVVDGMTHYQWTDDATDDEIASDSEPTLSDEAVRAPVETLLGALLDEVAGRAPWPFDDVTALPPGAHAP